MTCLINGLEAQRFPKSGLPSNFAKRIEISRTERIYFEEM
jgi:hypothetical protein